jgi:hypothetical protein
VLLATIVLLEGTKQIGNEEDEEDGPQANSGSAAGAPSTVAVVAAAPAEYEHQDNNEYDDHLQSPSITDLITGLMQHFDVA